jgi:hypothetical protein
MMSTRLAALAVELQPREDTSNELVVRTRQALDIEDTYKNSLNRPLSSAAAKASAILAGSQSSRPMLSANPSMPFAAAFEMSSAQVAGVYE